MTGQLLRRFGTAAPVAVGSVAKATPTSAWLSCGLLHDTNGVTRRVSRLRHVVTPVCRRTHPLPRPATRWTRRLGPGGPLPFPRHLPGGGAGADPMRHPSISSQSATGWSVCRASCSMASGPQPLNWPPASHRSGSRSRPWSTSAAPTSRSRHACRPCSTRRSVTASLIPAGTGSGRCATYPSCASGGRRRPHQRNTRMAWPAPSRRMSMERSPRCWPSSVPSCPGRT